MLGHQRPWVIDRPIYEMFVQCLEAEVQQSRIQQDLQQILIIQLALASFIDDILSREAGRQHDITFETAMFSFGWLPICGVLQHCEVVNFNANSTYKMAKRFSFSEMLNSDIHSHSCTSILPINGYL